MVQETIATLAEQGYRVPPEYIFIDDGLSGGVRDRPEFQQWLAVAREGKVRALGTYHADRLTREGMNVGGIILDVVEGKDHDTGRIVRPPVRLIDTKGTDSNEPTSFRWKFLIAAEVAREERLRIIDRNTDTQARLRKKLLYRGGLPPYGYLIVPHPGGEGKALDINPDESEWVRTAAEFILAGGSLYACTTMLNEAGVKPRRADAWSVTAVRSMLVGESVLGRVTHLGSVIRDEDGLPVAPWPAILSIEESEQLRAALQRKTRSTQRRKAGRLLSGLLVCASCGSKLKVNPSNGVVRYVCAHKANGKPCVRPVTVNAPNIDDHVESEFLKQYGRSQETRLIYSVQDAAGLTEVERALQQLSTKMIQPGANVAEIAAQITNLQEKRTQLESQPVVPVSRRERTGRTLKQAWEQGTLHERQALLRQYIAADEHGEVKIRVRPSDRTRRKGVDPTRFYIPWKKGYIPDSPLTTGRTPRM